MFFYQKDLHSTLSVECGDKIKQAINLNSSPNSSIRSHTHTPTYKLTNSPTSYKHYFTYIPYIGGLILLYNKNPAINCSPCHPLTLQALIHRLHHRHLQHQVAEPLTGGAGDPGAQSRLAPTHLTSRESNRGKSGSLKRSLASWRRKSKHHLKRSLSTIPIATSTR